MSWGRGSALTRMTGDLETMSKIFHDIKRETRRLVSERELPELKDAAGRVESGARPLGVHASTGFRPQLDESYMSVNSGGITLHDGEIPVRQFGLGTLRLVATAIHRDSVANGAILLIDEVEHGIDPYRLRNFIRYLRPSESGNGQSIMVTHSPIVISELVSNELYVVRSLDGGITNIGRVDDSLQDLVRRIPEALLARKIIICEGKTEVGLLRGLNRSWVSSSGIGFEYFGVAFGVGEGSSAPLSAIQTRALGYDTLFFVDSDRDISPTREAIEASGAIVAQWSGKTKTEERIMSDIPMDTLQKVTEYLLDDIGEYIVKDALATRLDVNPASLTGMSINDWLANCGKTETEFRVAFSNAACGKRPWFKRIDKGEELFGIIEDSLEHIPDSDLVVKLSSIEAWIKVYCTPEIGHKKRAA